MAMHQEKSYARSMRLLAALVLLSSTAVLGQDNKGERADMVRIAGGSYTMGSDSGREDEHPAHQVKLEAFWLDRYEVTNARFAAFLREVIADPGHRIRLVGDATPGAANERHIRGTGAVLLLENTRAPDRRTLVALNDDESRIGIRSGRLFVQSGFERHPVNEVTWNGARSFCAWRGARLPTEAEWEAAARGGDGRIYPWGNEPPDARRAVFGRASNETGAVGGRPLGATPQGIHDLAGNVAEWTSSLYRPYPYRNDDGREDPGADGERVTRGGDHVFDSSPEKLRASFRAGFSRNPAVGHRHIGFRCAR